MQTKYLLLTIVLTACTNSVTVQSSSPPPAKTPELTTASPTPKGSPIGAGAGAPVKESQDNKSANSSQQSSCNYFAGNAIGNQAINVDTCSIKHRNPRSVGFVYYLGSERVESSANCPDFRWTTYPENQVHTPQSLATENMLRRVCQ